MAVILFGLVSWLIWCLNAAVYQDKDWKWRWFDLVWLIWCLNIAVFWDKHWKWRSWVRSQYNSLEGCIRAASGGGDRFCQLRLGPGPSWDSDQVHVETRTRSKATKVGDAQILVDSNPKSCLSDQLQQCFARQSLPKDFLLLRLSESCATSEYTCGWLIMRVTLWICCNSDFAISINTALKPGEILTSQEFWDLHGRGHFEVHWVTTHRRNPFDGGLEGQVNQLKESAKRQMRPL